MSAYIDETYVDRAIGEDTAAAFCNNDSDALLQLIEAASSMIDSVLSNAGYATPLATPAPDLVRMATLGALLPQLYGRKGITVPPEYDVHINVFNAIKSGDLPIPGLTPNPRDAVGGLKFTPATGDGSKPRVFGRLWRVW